METSQIDARVAELGAQVEAASAELKDVLHALGRARAAYFRGGRKPEALAEMERLEARAKEIDVLMGRVGMELQELGGISDELVESIVATASPLDKEPRIMRGSLRKESFAPTAMIEDLLPAALAAVTRQADARWLKSQRANSWRLDGKFLSEPLSITRGVRRASEERPIHRFAQSVFVAEDFLAKNMEYDHFAGALLVPQVLALGMALEVLHHVPGDTKNRIHALWAGVSGMHDATVFELLVGAACYRMGRNVEFLASQGSSTPTPDLRCTDQVIPLVIECKRQAQLSAYEMAEEQSMIALFGLLRTHAVKHGLWGVFDVRLSVEHASADLNAVAEAAIRQRLAANPSRPTVYDWGSVAFHERPERMHGKPMRVHSPDFLEACFDWTSDVPDFDGIVCLVEAGAMLAESIRKPLALRWVNESPKALTKRGWTTMGLLGDATKQIPPGESGLIYTCYREGTREVVSDNRTNKLLDQMRDLAHLPDIRIPTAFVVRLYPRALGSGEPDLIESAIPLVNRLYGNDVYATEYPSSVFTTGQQRVRE